MDLDLSPDPARLLIVAIIDKRVVAAYVDKRVLRKVFLAGWKTLDTSKFGFKRPTSITSGREPREMLMDTKFGSE
jgi:hypothetical protein